MQEAYPDGLDLRHMSLSSEDGAEQLPPTHTTHLSSTSRSKLAARRFLPSEKAKGKQRAIEHDIEGELEVESTSPVENERTGRNVTIIFSNESDSGGGNLELWVEEGQSVGSVKEQVRVVLSESRLLADV